MLCMFVCVCACMFVCVRARVCGELSRDQHTCRWVFITAGLSDGLAYGRPLFIVIALTLRLEKTTEGLLVCLCALTHTHAYV